MLYPLSYEGISIVARPRGQTQQQTPARLSWPAGPLYAAEADCSTGPAVRAFHDAE